MHAPFDAADSAEALNHFVVEPRKENVVYQVVHFALVPDLGAVVLQQVGQAHQGLQLYVRLVSAVAQLNRRFDFVVYHFHDVVNVLLEVSGLCAD